MGGWVGEVGVIDMEQKGYEFIIHDHVRDLCVTMIQGAYRPWKVLEFQCSA